MPPPILASDFVKGGGTSGDAKVPSLSPTLPPSANHQSNGGDFLDDEQQQHEKKQRSVLYGDSPNAVSPRSEEDVFMEPKNPLSREQQDHEEADTNNNKNGADSDHSHDNNNNKSWIINNNNENGNQWGNKTNYHTPKGVSVLPSIKEEARSKLEDQINKLRNDQELNISSSSPYQRQQQSPFSDTNNNSSENFNASPISGLPVNRRPKQYCT